MVPTSTVQEVGFEGIGSVQGVESCKILSLGDRIIDSDIKPQCTASRAGLRHVWTVRPNRAANFRGPPFWTL